MKTYRVTWQDAIEGHQYALLDGGMPGILDKNIILAALARPYHGYHRWIWQKAAALSHGIITNHGFVDGNKRTALYLVDLLAEKSGWEVDMKDDEITDLFVSVASGEAGYEELADWFRHRFQRPEAE